MVLPFDQHGTDCRLVTALAKDAELVAFGVRQDNPRLLTLADINMPCAMSHQTSHLGVLIIRREVEMQPALRRLALVKPYEVQPRQAIRLGADRELHLRGVHHNPTKSLGPPLPQGRRICRMNNDMLPFQAHPLSVGLPGFRDIFNRTCRSFAFAVLAFVRGSVGLER